MIVYIFGRVVIARLCLTLYSVYLSNFHQFSPLCTVIAWKVKIAIQRSHLITNHSVIHPFNSIHRIAAFGLQPPVVVLVEQRWRAKKEGKKERWKLINQTYLKYSPVTCFSAGSVAKRMAHCAPCQGFFMNSHIHG